MPRYRVYFGSGRAWDNESWIERLPDPPQTLRELLDEYGCTNIKELYLYIESLREQQNDDGMSYYGLACQVED